MVILSPSYKDKALVFSTWGKVRDPKKTFTTLNVTGEGFVLQMLFFRVADFIPGSKNGVFRYMKGIIPKKLLIFVQF